MKKLRDIVESIKLTSRQVSKIKKASTNRFRAIQRNVNYSSDDIKGIKSYTDDPSVLNSHLLHKNDANYAASQDFKYVASHVDHIDRNISSAIKRNRLPRKVILYHGAGFDPSSFPKNEEGKHVLHNPAYLSTTTDAAKASNFSDGASNGHNFEHFGNILRIHVPKGSHAAVSPVSPDDKSNWKSEEKEIVLHKGHKLHINPVPMKVKYKPSTGKPEFDVEREYKVWTAHLVHDGVHHEDV